MYYIHVMYRCTQIMLNSYLLLNICISLQKTFQDSSYIISKTSKTVLILTFITFEIWNITTFTRTETYFIKTKHYSNGKQRHVHLLRKFVDNIALRMWNVDFFSETNLYKLFVDICVKYQYTNGLIRSC
jgi:hypothetical protein